MEGENNVDRMTRKEPTIGLEKGRQGAHGRSEREIEEDERWKKVGKKRKRDPTASGEMNRANRIEK